MGRGRLGGPFQGTHISPTSPTPTHRSLFEKDKLLFAFVLASKLMMDSGKMDPTELRFLLTGGVALGDLPEANPDPEWISEKVGLHAARPCMKTKI